jgi:2,4-dienoyl-CoA reductase-like NADH-dependent reductase (Old Yellow Enzyme family)
MSSHLFSPLAQRSLTFRNRVVMAPMCQYSAIDGVATDWLLAHLGSRAAGGVGAIIAEASAVLPNGRISPADLGLWDDKHIEPLRRAFAFIASQGCVPGIQLAHAGRKASTLAPWLGGTPVGGAQGGWDDIVAPSALPFAAGHATPQELDEAGIAEVIEAFAAAARRAHAAGAQLVEVHAAHGNLVHQFLSPLTNRRTDRWGGVFENRTRLVREVLAAVRKAWPDNLPVWVRISATDWVDGGWNEDESVELSRELAKLGCDVVDVSTGGTVPDAKVPVGPGFQVRFAEKIRREAGVPTGAVGLITEPAQADAVVREGRADAVLLGRVLLREPQWAIHAARSLGQPAPIPNQYLRGF